MASSHVTCCIVGCGPAGAILGYLLARAGVDVLVLEKHEDFLRDFRGDTIHPSTAQLMDELGLGPEFNALPLRHSDTLSVVTDDGEFTVADFRRGSGRPLGFLPQWDFLNFVVEQARRYPDFSLRMRTEVVDLVRQGGRVTGVHVRDQDGTTSTLTADLVVAADGRDSVIRSQSGLRLVSFGAPMDVLWFRLSRTGSDPRNAFGRLAPGRLLIMIDRDDYWQVGYIIRKGGLDDLRAKGLAAFRQQIVSLTGFVGDRANEIVDWDDIALLRVQLHRLRRWWRPGLLCIGDAAHAMSPVGGVGINLAIQDAVATARILAGPLRRRRLSSVHLARVQVRRALPAILTQAVQRVIQKRVLARVLTGEVGQRAPAGLRLIDRTPALQAIPAWAIGRGVLPEHAPPHPKER